MRRGRGSASAMEFRCRLGTPGGEIIEGVYVADSEARLRHEFEEKGLYVLGHSARRRRRARAAFALPTPGPDLDARVPRLQPGAGDAAQGRHAAGAVARHPAAPRHQPGLQGRCWTTSTSGCGRAARCRRRSRRTARCFPGVYTASLLAGEKSGNLEQVIRRYVAYVKVVASVRRKTISALVYPAILMALSLVVVVDHRAAGRAGVRRVLRAVRPGAAALDADHRGDLDVRRHVFPADRRGAGRLVGGRRSGPWLQRAGQPRAVRSLDAAAADARRRSRGSSRPRRRRARWRRCSAAASRW